MTWLDFKKAVESEGVTDSTEIDWIDVDLTFADDVTLHFEDGKETCAISN